MDFKDYYQILGVSPDATEKEIKQTFRKLARQYHPDVNPGDKSAEGKFKEVNEAYQVLSDAEQRKKYDAMRAEYQQWQKMGGRRQGQDFDYSSWAAQPGEVSGVRYSAEDLEDLFGGDSPFSDFFTSSFGGARASWSGQGGRAGAASRPRRGRDLEHEVEITLEEAFHGASRLLQIGDRRIEAKIPPGVDTGSRIRLAGQGEPGRNGGEAGDIYLVVRVLPHPTFERQGDDLYVEAPVDIYTAALGGEVRVPTLDGAVMLKIPPRTQSGRSFRVRGKGMPKRGDRKNRGDLYARINLVLPEPLTERELEAFRELAAARRGAEARA
ncbi:MAG TPA: J domain-containing protein [Chloroflexia bacterium]|nr:J domain-containing protein [Chloroflexia bacterium]